MDDKDIRGFSPFWALVQYHYDANYAQCRNFIINGKNTDPYKPRTIEEGISEIDYKGFLIIANGQSLLERMLMHNIVTEKNKDKFPSEVPDADAFCKYLKNQKNPDGAYVLDTENWLIWRIYRFNNDFDSITSEGTRPLIERLSLNQRLPSNFVHFQGDPNSDDDDSFYRANVGLKTKFGSGITQIYPDIDAYQIKRTAFGDFNFGIVAHFAKDGLKKRFYFTSKDCEDLYIDNEKKVSGIAEQFERDGADRPQVVSSRRIFSDGKGSLRSADIPSMHASCAVKEGLIYQPLIAHSAQYGI